MHQSGGDSGGVDAATAILMDLNVGLSAPTLWVSGSIKQVQDFFIVQLQQREVTTIIIKSINTQLYIMWPLILMDDSVYFLFSHSCVSYLHTGQKSDLSRTNESQRS